MRRDGRSENRSGSHPAVDDASDLCRKAVELFRTDAFDNVDTGWIPPSGELASEDIEWIGRRLLAEGSSLDAYEAGRRILSKHRFPDVP